MNLTQNMMNKAVEAKIIEPEQAIRLVDFLSGLPDQNPKFNLTNVLYYFGGLIAIAAMSLFMGLGWSVYGGWGILILSLSYALLGSALCLFFEERGNTIPAGICATFVVALTPLAIYGLQQGMGWWPEPMISNGFIVHNQFNCLFMEIGTLIVGVLVTIIYRYPFVMMPIAVSLWFLAMDLSSLITGERYTYVLTVLTTMYLGLVMLLVAFWIDMRTKSSIDYSFWLYIFGLLTFWCGLTGYYTGAELSNFIYLCSNLFLLFMGVALYRTIFVLFGGMGVCIYLGHLTYSVFKFSYLFPVTLTIIGFGIIYLGILWQMHGTVWTQKIRLKLPEQVRKVLQARDNI